MKFRLGFVSNSSSSSFIIKIDRLSGKQLKKILNHCKCGTRKRCHSIDDGDRCKLKNGERCRGIHSNHHCSDYLSRSWYWDINFDENYIKGHTSMDNFNMRWYLNNIVKVDDDDIEWGD